MEAQVHPNGFITVWDGADSYHVGEMVGIVHRQMRANYRPDANDMRPSCTCRNGHAERWCAHKETAYHAARHFYK